MREVTRMGAWDCPVCGKKKIKGTSTHCGGCGHPRGKNIKFYLPPDAEVVDDSWASKGADWNCAYCDGDNSNDNEFCENCGHKRDGEDSQRQKVKYGSAVPRTAEEAKASQDSSLSQHTQRPRVRTRIRDGGRQFASKIPERVRHVRDDGIPKKYIAIAVLGFFTFAWLFWFFFLATEEIELEAVAFSWDREIQIERYVWVNEEAWDSAPTGARNIRSNREVHHYDKVLDHYETKYRTVYVACGTEEYNCGTTDNGNGTLTTKYCTRTKYCDKQESYKEAVYRDEPVYKNKYYYEIQRWRVKRSVDSSGENNTEAPYWPDTMIGNGQYAGFKEREGKKSQEYRVYFLYKMDEETRKHTESLHQSEWAGIEKGEKFLADINRAGMIRNRHLPENQS